MAKVLLASCCSCHVVGVWPYQLGEAFKVGKGENHEFMLANCSQGCALVFVPLISPIPPGCGNLDMISLSFLLYSIYAKNFSYSDWFSHSA